MSAAAVCIALALGASPDIRAATAAPADRALLEAVMAERGVERTPATPGARDYALDVMQRVAERLSRSLTPLRTALARHPGFIPGVALAVGVLAVLVALAAVGFVLVRRVQPPRPARPDVVFAGVAVPSRPGGRDAAGWRRELEARLVRGDVRGAVEAAWWWVAAAVSAGAPDPAWTTRELVRRAGRRELARAARDLDRLAYGPSRPSEPDVRALARSLDAVLA